MRPMIVRSIPNVALAVLFLGGPAACSPDQRMPAAANPGTGGPMLAPPTVPAALEPPAGATLAMRLAAEGAQVYVCKASMPAATFAWTLKAPDARLFDASGKQVGIHFGGPTWQSSVDGSAVVGAKVADAPATGTIAWLLLRAQANAGKGVFSGITAVQRVDTMGGLAPTDGCDATSADKEQAVPYRANYYFYASASAPPAFEAAQGEQAFTARLTGDAEVPPVTTAASGTFELVLDAAQTELRYRLRHNMTGATVAHLHTGLPGEAGPVAIALPVALDDLTGTLAITPAQVADLQAGRLYANVHSPAHATGEIRGQLARAAGTY